MMPDVPALLGHSHTHAVVALEGVLDRAVAQVEAGDVHAHADHHAKRRVVVGGGTDGGDDLGATLHAEHATGQTTHDSRGRSGSRPRRVPRRARSVISLVSVVVVGKPARRHLLRIVLILS